MGTPLRRKARVNANSCDHKVHYLTSSAMLLQDQHVLWSETGLAGTGAGVQPPAGSAEHMRSPRAAADMRVTHTILQRRSPVCPPSPAERAWCGGQA